MKSFKLNVLLVLTGITSMTISSRAQTSLLWSETAGTAASNQKSFVATDLLGNIYMACAVNGTYGLDWKVSSWRPDSVSRWTYTYNGTGNLDDVPSAIHVDSAFSVFVCGTTRSSGSNDMRIIKLDSAGTLKWGTNYNRTGSAHDVAAGMAVWGNRVYVCGHSQQSTSNYDYTVLKYDTAGTLLWSRHANGTGSGDDYTTSIAVKTGGSDIFVTGNAVITGGTRDMMTLRYSNDGTLQWTKYYGNTTGQNDYGNAIAINYSGDIIVTGQSYVTGTNSNLTTVKYSGSSGAQAWAASYAGTYGGHDAAYSVVIDPDNYFYVTGYTQVGSSNTDYVTIKYKGNGSVTWAQTYNGPGNGTDEACTVIHDGYDIVVTGKSTGTGSGLDVCTISMDKVSGAVNWTMRETSVSSGTDCGYSLARDEMGNVYVAYNSLVSSGYSNCCLRYFQKDKNDTAITKCLEVIAAGFSDLKTDTVFKRVIWYNILRGYDDSIYLMYADALRSLGDAAGVSATTKISAKIAATYSWNSSYNWAVIKSKQMWTANGKVKPLMGVPKLYQFSKSGFISANTNTAFTYLEYDYPVGCVTCGDKALDTSDITGKAAWVFFVNVPPFLFNPTVQYKAIVNCFLGSSLVLSQPCEICPVNPLSAYTNLSGSFAGNHEIGVWLHLGDYGDLCGSVTDVNTTDLIVPGNLSSANYAVLIAMPGYYWRKFGSGNGEVTLYKSILPHISDRNATYVPITSDRQHANRITLCDDRTLFHDYYESSGGQRFFLDFGGMYKIERPGIIGMTPMYFYFSPFKYFTFTQGPDMNLNYDGSVPTNNCASGRQEFIQLPSIENCEFASPMNASFNITNGKDYFANPSVSFLNNYWTDNVITVGFATAGNSCVYENYVQFYADNTGSTCDPMGFSDVGNLAVSLGSINSTSAVLGDGYETAEIFDNVTGYVTGTRFLIHVQARFTNGETIDQCQYFTINSNVFGVDLVATMIRGSIEDYSSSPVNYKVDVYETI